MSRIYLAKIGDDEKLIEAGNINAARNHVAKSVITISLASQADLFRLAQAGAKIEAAGDEAPQAEQQPPKDETGKGGKADKAE